MKEQLTQCRICPRQCGVDRTVGQRGYCGETAAIRAARAALHHWEEPPISGDRGSGTVFFSGCNLRCVFCQNASISQGGTGREIGPQRLAELMLDLQGQGAHNINLVTGTPHTPGIADALALARKGGLVLPVIWNSSGYESPDALRRLEGLVDVYLPDLKYAGEDLSQRYSGAADYFAAATRAILEMLRQVGPPEFSGDLIRRGLMVRHLMLPGALEDTKKVLDWIAGHLPHSVYVSLMSQYLPQHRAADFPELNRGITGKQLRRSVDYFFALGLENGFVQELDAADPRYIPAFDFSGI